MPATARYARYRELLFQHLDGQEEKEITFFLNPRRFDLLQEALGDKLTGKTVLNIGSGPFALEFYVGPRCDHIDSLDIDPQLVPLHAAMVAEGLIAPSRFTCSDAMAYEPHQLYDVIIINDVLFSKHVDYHQVLAKYAGHLKPGGYLYFDVLDARAGPIWALVNNDQRYRRYSMAEVTEALRRHDFTLELQKPSFGIKGGLDRAGRKLLWHLARVANNVIFLARKSSLSLTSFALFAHSGLHFLG